MRALCWIAALLAVGCFEDAARPGVCTFGERRDCTCDDGGPGWETCYNDSPAVWGPCICNGQPIADAGNNQTVSYNTTVRLDASRTRDTDGPDRIYEWMIESVPAGSLAMLDDPSSARPSFFTDLPGEYRFTLLVSDGLKTSALSSVMVTAVNDAPVAIVEPGGALHAGTQFVLDGSASSDLNSDPLTYEWSVTSAPADSVAQPAEPTAATTEFVPDVVGTYELSLTVHDGRTSSAPATITLDAYYPLWMLPFIPLDAEYSRALDRVVMIGQFPHQLYVYDPATGDSVAVPLSRVPTALSLSPDGLTAVVGHEALISIVQLQTPVVSSTRSITGTTAFDIVHGGNGYAYVFPSATSRAIQNVPLAGGPITAGSDTIEYRAQLVPGTLTMYAAPTFYDGIFRIDIVANSATVTRAVSSDSCDELWISDDGQRIFTRCGTVYSISDDAASDMLLQGPIPGASFVKHLSQSSSAGKLLVAPGNMPASSTLRVYSYPSLAFEKSIELPLFLVNGMPSTGLGAFAFLRADNTTFTVIQRTASSSSPVYGMGTFEL